MLTDSELRIEEAAPVAVVVVVLTSLQCNAVGGHRTGSNNSGVGDHLRKK